MTRSRISSIQRQTIVTPNTAERNHLYAVEEIVTNQNDYGQIQQSREEDIHESM
eukprot:CAMPEP_0172503532 /NCGR_PEP_ID=MMETSP1066-20121228/170122_1 /TAXON_ID=671091 /ORGANISM="Coscinodiscus wailesii, Strain CCMP2513" /LENGTH=53 /DNA_ID=CAMNT_0013279311 /DNA_START=48 /DNA_END=206 /DNA_ORIENTATION=-